MLTVKGSSSISKASGEGCSTPKSLLYQTSSLAKEALFENFNLGEIKVWVLGRIFKFSDIAEKHPNLFSPTF